jgi:hypothetical protein
MADQLSSRQLAQLAVLELLPARFEQLHRLIEEIASLRADESVIRRIRRILDETKAAANTVGLSSLSDIMGNMGMIARRNAGVQMKIRGLREGLVSLKINYDGALRSAKMPLPETAGKGPKDA